MKKLFLLLYTCFLAISVDAQDCATALLHKELMQTDPAYKAKYLKLEKQRSMAQQQMQGQMRRQTYTIPIVVHVIHLGEPEGTGSNIPDADIYAAIDGLNDRFSNTIGNGVDLEIEFCLASSDPNGCPTNGINRVDGSFVQGFADYGIGGIGSAFCQLAADQTEIKDLSKWPVSDYYNVWVVHTIPQDDCSSEWGGYANYPYGGPHDGTVIKSARMVYSSTTLAHELGHGFNLKHTFEDDGGDAVCPDNFNCATDGDEVCDTPPHKQSDCGGSNPCSGTGDWNNSRYNYMSYCSFPSSAARFTQGQKDRVNVELVSYPRDALLNSSGCDNPGFDVQANKSNASCDSSCNGEITLSIWCPSSSYTYLWSNQDTTPTISGLCPGIYEATVTNAIGLTEYVSETISANQAPAATLNLPTGSKSICKKNTALKLSGGNPPGGSFSGNGVGAEYFYPNTVDFGKHLITYTYTDMHECTATASDTITVKNCTGIAESNSLENIAVAPNPVYKNLMITWPEKVVVRQLILQNLSGKIIESIDITDNNNYELNMEALPNGIYFLTINGIESRTIKVMKMGQP